MARKGSPKPWTSTASMWASADRRCPTTTGMPGSLTKTPTPPRGPQRWLPAPAWTWAGRNWLDQ
eukprot:3495667-Alexandrium_andersonii.AAC.1